MAAGDEKGYYRDKGGWVHYYGYSKPGAAAKTLHKVGKNPQKYLRKKFPLSWWVALFFFPALPVLAAVGAGIGGGIVASILCFLPALLCFWWGLRGKS